MVGRIVIILVSATVVLVAARCSEPVEQVTVPEELPQPDHRFDLNTVTYEQLQTISGLKRNVALNIIEFRKYGRFHRVEDLLAVSGIGEKTYLLIRRYFYVKKPRR